MHKAKKIIPVALTFMPMFALAAKTIEELITQVGDIIRLLVPLLIAIALVIFIIGVIRYITAGDSEEKRAAARNTIIYGVIGLFAIVAVWGLVEIIRETFEVRENQSTLPNVPEPTESQGTF